MRGRPEWRDPRAGLAAALVAAAWLLRYVMRFGLHLSRPPHWADYFDQSRYIASALAFGAGDLAPAAHWYPLGYPLIAAPFAAVIPHEPFFLPDLALFVATAFAFAAVMRRLGLGLAGATLLFLLGDLGSGKVARLWTVPWTTTLSAPLIWGLIAQTLHVVEPPADDAPPRRRAMLLLGLLAGALPLVRPTDGLLGFLALLFAATALGRHGRLRASGLACAVLGALAMILPYALLHLAIYGPHVTDYARAAANQGFALADLPWKTYLVLVTAAPWFPHSPSLVEMMPWIVPGLAGLGLCWWQGDARARRALGLIALLGIPYAALFLAYTDLQPPGVWRYDNAHYFKWLFPLLGAGAWAWLRFACRRATILPALIALALVLAPAAIRPLPAAVPDTAPARMLMFRGAAGRVWDEAYFAPATVTDARGTMANVSRFHQFPDPDGERAIAVWRLFEGPARRDDPGETAAFRTGQAPYARYAVRLSPGLPCWLPRQPACRLPTR